MSWIKEQLADAPVKIIDGDRGKNYPAQNELLEDGYCLFLSATNVTKDGFVFDKCQFINEQKDNALKKGRVRKNDIVLTTRGTLGNVSYYSDAVPFEHVRINSGMVTIQSDIEKLRSRYLYYFLKSELFQVQIRSLQSGAAQPQLPIRDIKKIKISYPDPILQDRIADMVGVYDDLIENNRRRIVLLEEAARLLYREWFVHFRFPGHQHVKIIDGVPEGWHVKKVGELLARLKTKPKIRKDEYLEQGSFPCVDQGQRFVGGFTDNLEAIYRAELPLIVFGDHTRALKFVDFPFARGADGTQICQSNDTRLSQEMFYWALVSIDLSNYFYARHFKFLKDQEILIPDQSLADNFTRFSHDSFKQINILRQQNTELLKARDLLLPRLMDGRLEV